MARTLQRGLTAGQALLLERHRGGVVRLAATLSDKRGCHPSEVIVLLAHKASRIGGAAREHFDFTQASEVIVIPGVLRDLPQWIAWLATSGPVFDCAGSEQGVPVIVVDENGEMAVCRVACEGAAASFSSHNRSIIPPG